MRKRLETAKVFDVRLDVPLAPLEVEERYRDVVLVVRSESAVLGEVVLPALRVVPVDVQRAAIAEQLGEALWRQRLASTFRRAVLAEEGGRSAEPASVSVVVCTRDRPEDLERCLESLARLVSAPEEIVVVDNCPSDERTRLVCARHPVRYVLEELPGLSRARNRGIAETSGDLVAFTDDDCVVDPGWLDGLDEPFSDPLVMLVTGYIAALELETAAQYLFEQHGGFARHGRARVFDGSKGSPATEAGQCGAGANMVLRRRVFEQIGLFAEELGAGTPARSVEDTYMFYRVLAAGYRIRFDPARVVKHRHRRDLGALRKVLVDSAAGGTALAALCLSRHRELAAFRIVLWWWFTHIRGDLSRVLRRDERRLPLRLLLAEALGTIVGPWRLVRSIRSRRRIEPIELPAASRAETRPVLAVAADNPRLSVALASYNRREKLREVLEGLAGQRYPAERFEVVLVLDGSTDGSAEMARTLDVPFDLRVVEQENRGLAATRNRGAREARHPVVVFLDDDIVPEPAFLTEHARAHRLARNDHLALGYYPPVSAEDTLWAQQVRTWWEDHFRRKADPRHQWTYIDLCDGNSSLPRPLFLASGCFDEAFRGGRRQDWEFGIRLLRRGVRFAYYPGAVGLHYLNTSFATALRQRREEGRYDVEIARKHPHVKAQLPLGAIALALGEGIYRRASLAYRHPAASEHFLAAALPAANLLEKSRLRSAWSRLTFTLMSQAYVLGLTDALPTPEEFFRFVGPLWQESVLSVPVRLDRPLPLAIPGGAGSVELSLALAGEPLSRVVAIDPGGQWDWNEVTDRVVARASEPVRAALLLERLGASPPGRRAMGAHERAGRAG